MECKKGKYFLRVDKRIRTGRPLLSRLNKNTMNVPLGHRHGFHAQEMTDFRRNFGARACGICATNVAEVA